MKAILLAENGYHELGFWYPLLRLRELGADVAVAGPEAGQTYMSALGYPVVTEIDLAAAAAAKPDLLIVPGGAAGERLSSTEPGRAAVAEAKSMARSFIIGTDPDDLPAQVAAGTGAPAEPHLRGARIVVLAESQYQELELWYPVLRFREAGADVVVASPARGALYEIGRASGR